MPSPTELLPIVSPSISCYDLEVSGSRHNVGRVSVLLPGPLRRNVRIMDIQRIEFPHELLEHNLSAQEQANIPADKLALAKDWNIIKRQNEWMIREIMTSRHLLAEQHDKVRTLSDQMEFWTRVRWGVATLVAATIAVLTILQKIGVFK